MVENVLNKIKDKGEKLGVFCLGELGCVCERLDKKLLKTNDKSHDLRCDGFSCLLTECKTIKIKVFPFDEVKNQLSSKMEINPPKSCDGIVIFPLKKQIDFIEKKSLGDFFNIELPYIKEKTQEAIESKVDNFDFMEKLTGSLFCLEFILRNKYVDASKLEIKNYYATLKNYFIVVDIDRNKNAVRYISATFTTWSKTSSVSIEDCSGLLFDRISSTISNMKREDINLQRPRLFTCKELEDYYREHKME